LSPSQKIILIIPSGSVHLPAHKHSMILIFACQASSWSCSCNSFSLIFTSFFKSPTTEYEKLNFFQLYSEDILVVNAVMKCKNYFLRISFCHTYGVSVVAFHTLHIFCLFYLSSLSLINSRECLRNTPVITIFLSRIFLHIYAYCEN